MLIFGVKSGSTRPSAIKGPPRQSSIGRDFVFLVPALKYFSFQGGAFHPNPFWCGGDPWSPSLLRHFVYFYSLQPQWCGEFWNPPGPDGGLGLHQVYATVCGSGPCFSHQKWAQCISRLLALLTSSASFQKRSIGNSSHRCCAGEWWKISTRLVLSLFSL